MLNLDQCKHFVPETDPKFEETKTFDNHWRTPKMLKDVKRAELNSLKLNLLCINIFTNLCQPNSILISKK